MAKFAARVILRKDSITALCNIEVRNAENQDDAEEQIRFMFQGIRIVIEEMEEA